MSEDGRCAHLPQLHNMRVFELLVVDDLSLNILRDLSFPTKQADER